MEGQFDTNSVYVKECVEKLPEPYQLLIKMKYYEWKSDEQIAAHFLLSMESVKADLFKARKLLIELLPRK